MRCTRGIVNAPPPLVPSERVLVDSVWDHTSESARRESVDVMIFQVDSRTDGKMCLDPVREARVGTGWNVERVKIGDERILGRFRHGKRFEIQFRKGTIVAKSTGSVALSGFGCEVDAQAPAIQAKTADARLAERHGPRRHGKAFEPGAPLERARRLRTTVLEDVTIRRQI